MKKNQSIFYRAVRWHGKRKLAREPPGRMRLTPGEGMDEGSWRAEGDDGFIVCIWGHNEPQRGR